MKAVFRSIFPSSLILSPFLQLDMFLLFCVTASIHFLLKSHLLFFLTIILGVLYFPLLSGYPNQSTGSYYFTNLSSFLILSPLRFQVCFLIRYLKIVLYNVILDIVRNCFHIKLLFSLALIPLLLTILKTLSNSVLSFDPDCIIKLTFLLSFS